VPVTCANAQVRPGDVVVADAGGVVVVPVGRVGGTTEAARGREENEARKRMRPASGELGLDMYAMRGPLEAAGLRYVDRRCHVGAAGQELAERGRQEARQEHQAQAVLRRNRPAAPAGVIAASVPGP
jgi:hypothetical protein